MALTPRPEGRGFRLLNLTDDAFDDEGYFYTGDLFRVEDGGFVSFFD